MLNLSAPIDVLFCTYRYCEEMHDVFMHWSHIWTYIPKPFHCKYCRAMRAGYKISTGRIQAFIIIWNFSKLKYFSIYFLKAGGLRGDVSKPRMLCTTLSLLKRESCVVLFIRTSLIRILVNWTALEWCTWPIIERQWLLIISLPAGGQLFKGIWHVMMMALGKHWLICWQFSGNYSRQWG